MPSPPFARRLRVLAEHALTTHPVLVVSCLYWIAGFVLLPKPSSLGGNMLDHVVRVSVLFLCSAAPLFLAYLGTNRLSDRVLRGMIWIPAFALGLILPRFVAVRCGDEFWFLLLVPLSMYGPIVLLLVLPSLQGWVHRNSHR